MLIQRKQNRRIVFTAAMNSIPDVLIAAIIMMVFDGGFLVFIGVWVGLQLLYGAIFLKNIATFWVWYFLRTKKETTQYILDGLKENGFPQPAQHIDKAESYLEAVAVDENVKPETRLVAGMELGILQWLSGTVSFSQYLLFSVAYEDAIEKHNRTFPPKEKDSGEFD